MPLVNPMPMLEKARQEGFCIGAGEPWRSRGKVFSSIEDGVDKMVNVAGELEPDMSGHYIYSEMYRAYCAAYEGLAGSGAYDLLSSFQNKKS